MVVGGCRHGDAEAGTCVLKVAFFKACLHVLTLLDNTPCITIPIDHQHLSITLYPSKVIVHVVVLIAIAIHDHSGD
jgi:hypothetical protein